MTDTASNANFRDLRKCTNKIDIENFLIAKGGIKCDCRNECTEALHFAVQKIVYFSRTAPFGKRKERRDENYIRKIRYWMKDPSSKDRRKSGSATHWFAVKIAENWRNSSSTNYQNKDGKYLMLPGSFCDKIARMDRDKDRTENASEGHDGSDHGSDVEEVATHTSSSRTSPRASVFRARKRPRISPVLSIHKMIDLTDPKNCVSFCAKVFGLNISLNERDDQIEVVCTCGRFEVILGKEDPKFRSRLFSRMYKHSQYCVKIDPPKTARRPEGRHPTCIGWQFHIVENAHFMPALMDDAPATIAHGEHNVNVKRVFTQAMRGELFDGFSFDHHPCILVVPRIKNVPIIFESVGRFKSSCCDGVVYGDNVDELSGWDILPQWLRDNTCPKCLALGKLLVNAHANASYSPVSVRSSDVLRKKHKNMSIPEFIVKVDHQQREIRALKKKLARKVSSENGDVVV